MTWLLNCLLTLKLKNLQKKSNIFLIINDDKKLSSFHSQLSLAEN